MSIYSNICFYGGGAWGQALAITLSALNHNSTILVSDKIRETQINNSKSERFPNLKLSPLIQATTNKEKAIKDSDLIFITTESKRVLMAIEEISSFFKNKINGLAKCTITSSASTITSGIFDLIFNFLIC